jgi:isochorismate pyruvate lyase
MIAKKPNDCKTLEEIRKEIDKIDKQIISLFADRHKYVEEIVKYKHDEAGVVAQERKNQVIGQRREWAKEKGLNPDTFEKIYTLLVDSNIEHELEILKLKKNKKYV